MTIEKIKAKTKTPKPPCHPVNIKAAIIVPMARENPHIIKLEGDFPLPATPSCVIKHEMKSRITRNHQDPELKNPYLFTY